jgi:uncharacterized membrane protein YhaH (DUF805 family)
MAFCKNCGTDNLDDLDIMICVNCGHQLYEDFDMYQDASELDDIEIETTFENRSVFGYIIKCLRKYASFTGRARRKEFWSFALFIILIGVGLWGLFGLVSVKVTQGGEIEIPYITTINIPTIEIPYILALLVFFLPLIAVLTRRMHDIGRNAWLLLWYLPIVPIFFLRNSYNLDYVSFTTMFIIGLLFVYLIILLVTSVKIVYRLLCKGQSEVNKHGLPQSK